MNPNDALLLIGIAATSGLAGSVHCAGMCGGIASATAVASCGRVRTNGWRQAALFHGGRIGGYATLGAGLAAATRGATMTLPSGLEALGRAAMAICMVLLALRLLLNVDPLRLEGFGARVFRLLAPAWRATLVAPSWLRPAAFGLVWGFMPCGLVYSILPVAAASGHPALAAACMAVFGLTTIPALLGVRVAVTRAATAHRAVPARLASGTLVLLCALWTAWGALLHARHQHGGQEHVLLTPPVSTQSALSS